jgi:nitrite reductase/ring-hydroxylating ferredoxin subunit
MYIEIELQASYLSTGYVTRQQICKGKRYALSQALRKEVEVMQTATVHRNIFQRILGICATKQPLDEGCRTFESGRIIVDLARAQELAGRNGAIRLEKKENVPERVLVIHGNDGEYHAFRNRCTHRGRRLDPVPGAQQVQCCSYFKSTFDYGGKKISGVAKEDLATYMVTVEGSKLLITL